ncbi:MAG: uroporphyrinogen-III synthase [Candidatus Marinimicrobia bacterium]|nr:uroporphyrinogen-III synthase [Candidatus Neomarinimicrobiota bacterium]
MLNTIVTMEPTRRIKKIFKSNLNVNYNFFSYYKYEVLSPNIYLINEILKGKYDWVIFTSYRAWRFVNYQFNSLNLEFPNIIKIAVFGKENSKRIKNDGRNVDFNIDVENSKIFINELINRININSKLVYFTSTAVNELIINMLQNKGFSITRQDNYKPISTINSSRIKILFKKNIPDSIIFFSTNSAKLFINTCNLEIIDMIQDIQLFAIGKKTAFYLQDYSNSDIIFPIKPDINKLSEIVNKFAKGESYN